MSTMFDNMSPQEKNDLKNGTYNSAPGAYPQTVPFSPQQSQNATNILDQLRPEAPTIDPRFKALQQSQLKQASDFRGSMASQANDLMIPQWESAVKGLATNQAGIKAGYNRRGLLYSGMNAGDQAAASSDAASQIAQARYNTNNTLYNQANNMDQSAIGTGMGMAGLGNNVAMTSLAGQQAALQQSMYNANQTGQIAGAIGQGVGGVLGGVLAPKAANPYSYAMG